MDDTSGLYPLLVTSHLGHRVVLPAPIWSHNATLLAGHMARSNLVSSSPGGTRTTGWNPQPRLIVQGPMLVVSVVSSNEVRAVSAHRRAISVVKFGQPQSCHPVVSPGRSKAS